MVTRLYMSKWSSLSKSDSKPPSSQLDRSEQNRAGCLRGCEKGRQNNFVKHSKPSSAAEAVTGFHLKLGFGMETPRAQAMHALVDSDILVSSWTMPKIV